MNILIPLLTFLATTNYVLAKENRPPGCKDPVYACQDLSTARMCGVLSDCIHDIWSTMKAPEDNNEICDLCKEMVKEARDQLLSNETQEEIKQVFEGSCKLLVVKVIVDECIKIVDDIIPELIEMLASRMDPNMVCTVAGLCNNAALKDLSIKDMLPSVLDSVVSAIKGGACDGCKSLLGTVKHIVSSIPQDQMQEILLHFCQQYPDISAKCSSIVESYLSVVYNVILTMDPTTTCKKIGVCIASNEIEKPSLKPGDELTCEFCESLVQYVRDIILTNSTKEEFRTALLNMCSRLGSFSAECKDLVNEYYDMVYDFIDKSLVPKTVCTDLGLCQPSGEKTVPMVKIVPMDNMWRGKHPNRRVNTLPPKIQNRKPFLVKVIPPKTNTRKSNNAEQQDSTNEIGDEPMQQLPIERMQNPLLTLTKDTDCAFSKAIMYFLEKDIQARNTKAITTALDNVCETWLPGYMKECEHFVRGNQKKIIELLLLGTPFDEVSGYLNLCHDEENPDVVLRPQVLENNGITCELCMQVMDFVKKEIADKKSEEEIREVLDKVCTYLPQSFVQDCEQFVNQYTDTIVNLILQGIDPNAVCHSIGLCSTEIHEPVRDDLDCELCKEIMDYVKSKLSEPKVEDEIKKILDEVCSILPTTWASKCEQFVNQYTDLIITLLLEEVDPDNICTMLGVCSSGANSAVIKAAKTKPATFNAVGNNADCEICTMVMNYIEKEVEDPTVESAIRIALDSVCSVLPTSYAVRCQQYVDKYTDQIIKLLVQNISPRMVCSLLQECPSQNIVCTLCQYALHFLQEQLMSNSTESEIKAVAKQLCSYLPDEMVGECSAFIDEYGDACIVLLAQQLDPSIICPLLKVCPSKALPKELPPAPVKDIKLDGCDICKTIVNSIDQLLEDAEFERELTDLAAKVCSVLPGTAKEECNSIVHLYGPYIIEMIGRLENGQQLCQSIDLCPRTPGHVHLLGGEKCTFGPSYWCHTHAHAVACKAETYCKQMVWKN